MDAKKTIADVQKVIEAEARYAERIGKQLEEVRGALTQVEDHMESLQRSHKYLHEMLKDAESDSAEQCVRLDALRDALKELDK